MSKLLHLLADLALNPQQQALYNVSPEAMLAIAGVVDPGNSALRWGNREAWTTALVDELATDELVAVMGSCTASDPGPDPTPDPDPLPEPKPDEWRSISSQLAPSRMT